MRKINSVCWPLAAAGLVLLCSLPGAAQSGVPADVQQACTPDAMRLCSEFVPDVAKITACMKAKHRQVSLECRTAMAGGHRPATHHRVRVRCGSHGTHCG